MKKLLLLLLLSLSTDGYSGSMSTTIGGSAATWRDPVATSGDLPSSGNNNGDCRVAQDSGAVYCWNSSNSWVSQGGGGGGGVDTVGSFSSSAQTNGASISGTTITFGPASATVPGMVSTGAQSWAGVKDFASLPTASSMPSSATQLVNKSYADGLASGFKFKTPAQAATTTTLPANTYANGASGVGATLTGNSNGALATQDGVSLTVNQILLVKNEAAAANNGIYSLTQVGDGSNPYILTRSTDCDTAAECVQGSALVVLGGTTLIATQWAISSVVTTMGTSAINWIQINAPLTYINGSGLDLTGTTFSISTGGVTNAMLAGSIADSKLSTISTAGKVSGAALTSLSSIPGGAGIAPVANLGTGTPSSSTFLRGDGTWSGSGPTVGANSITYSKTLDTNASTVTVGNTTTATTVYTYAVPANTLSTNGFLRVTVSGTYTNSSGLTPNFLMFASYGSAGSNQIFARTVAGSVPSSATTGSWMIQLYLQAAGSTSAQVGGGTVEMRAGGNAYSATDSIPIAKDSTISGNFVVAVQHSIANASITTSKTNAVVEQVNATDTVGAPTDAQYVTLTTNSSLSAERVLTGTANQITITDNTSTVVLSTPQDIAAASSPTFAGMILSGLTVSTVPYVNNSKAFTSSAVTPTELGFLSGVTSAVQTQLTAKAPLASPTFTGTVTLPSGSITSSAWDTGSSTFTSNGVAFTAKAPLASPTFTGTQTVVQLKPTTSALTDAATPALDASLGTVFTLVATGNRTIGIPSNPVAGQKITIVHTASGGARTLSLNTAPGGFRFGSDITAPTATASGKVDYLGAQYNAVANTWDVLAIVKGY